MFSVLYIQHTYIGFKGNFLLFIEYYKRNYVLKIKKEKKGESGVG